MICSYVFFLKSNSIGKVLLTVCIQLLITTGVVYFIVYISLSIFNFSTSPFLMKLYLELYTPIFIICGIGAIAIACMASSNTFNKLINLLEIKGHPTDFIFLMIFVI